VSEEIETKPSTQQQEGFFTRVGREKNTKSSVSFHYQPLHTLLSDTCSTDHQNENREILQLPILLDSKERRKLN